MEKSELFCKRVTDSLTVGGSRTQKSHPRVAERMDMDQRKSEEAAIREAALVCVSSLRVLSADHQALALRLIQGELAMFEYLDTEEVNRGHSTGAKD